MVSISLPGLRRRLRRLWNDSRGFNLTELLVLVAVIGIITTVSAPAFVSYWRSATLKETNARSEEHTSELQSRPHLVCRLLLEKKRENQIIHDNEFRVGHQTM